MQKTLFGSGFAGLCINNILKMHSTEKTNIAKILWLIIGISLTIHILSMIAGKTILEDWRWAHHPFHASVEMSGSVIALFVAVFLIIFERADRGTHFNSQIAAALIGMGVLDGFHAIVHAGNTFVWLHSTATIVGGSLFVVICFPVSWTFFRSFKWPLTVLIISLGIGSYSLLFPNHIPLMVRNEQFTFTAKWLNMLGGTLLFLSAFRLVQSYYHTRNTDDLLFCLHCSLFGAAAIMFEQSSLWDTPWWGWHLLRFMAYMVALWFIILSEKRILSELLKEIIERKKIEEILRESEGKHRSLIETAQDAIVCADEKGIINVWNKIAEKIFGYSRSEIIGQPVTTIMSEENKNKHKEGFERFIKTGKSNIIDKTIEIPGKTNEGIEMPLELSLSYQKIENERYTFTAIIRDVTEKKNAKKEIENLVKDLTHKNKDLEQLMFAMSHDLRSPMVNIQGYSKELKLAFEQVHSILKNNDFAFIEKEKLTLSLEKDIPESLKYIFTSISRIDSLILGLLRLTRLGSKMLIIRQLDMEKLVSDVVATHEYMLKEKDITLHINQLPPCSGDEMQINQVFSNLLDNALKYLDTGRKGIIEISGQRVNEYVVYSVKDNGIGISVEHHDKIFKVFKRLKPAEGTGEGLGLAIVCRILERHRGKIWVESEPGKGSEFFVSFSGMEVR